MFGQTNTFLGLICQSSEYITSWLLVQYVWFASLLNSSSLSLYFDFGFNYTFDKTFIIEVIQARSHDAHGAAAILATA